MDQYQTKSLDKMEGQEEGSIRAFVLIDLYAPQQGPDHCSVPPRPMWSGHSLQGPRLGKPRLLFCKLAETGLAACHLGYKILYNRGIVPLL